MSLLLLGTGLHLIDRLFKLSGPSLQALAFHPLELDATHKLVEALDFSLLLLNLRFDAADDVGDEATPLAFALNRSRQTFESGLYLRQFLLETVDRLNVAADPALYFL